MGNRGRADGGAPVSMGYGANWWRFHTLSDPGAIFRALNLCVHASTLFDRRSLQGLSSRSAAFYSVRARSVVFENMPYSCFCISCVVTSACRQATGGSHAHTHTHQAEGPLACCGSELERRLVAKDLGRRPTPEHRFGAPAAQQGPWVPRTNMAAQGVSEASPKQRLHVASSIELDGHRSNPNL